MSEQEKLIEILASVSDGRLMCSDGLKQVEQLNWDHLTQIQPVYGNLFHYWDDEDIRERDPAYREFQDQELKKLVDHLRECRFERARSISFLKESD